MENLMAPPSDSEDPTARLASWVDKRAARFEVIAQKRDADAPMAERALEIVRLFIIEKGLILYGGLAIDYALRLKGSKIYPKHQLPDYDCFSPQSVDHAYELADRLLAAGFPNVGAIPAIHVQTMRVATDFIYVADISYAPPEAFSRLPTISYGGMRVVHPDHQRTDMHLAFCFPFSNPPREDIYHRFAKDLKRFRLLQALYPIVAGAALNTPAAAAGGGDGAPVWAGISVDLGRAALHGFAAYAAVRRAFFELEQAARSAGVPAKTLAAARALVDRGPALEISVEARGNAVLVLFTPPALAPRLALASPWAEEVVPALASALRAPVEWFAPHMDTRPMVARIAPPTPRAPGVDVYSTRDRLLAITWLTLDGVRVAVVSLQYVLLSFLHEAHAAADAETRSLFVGYYLATLDLLEAGGALTAALRLDRADDEFLRFVGCSPFGLPVQTLGDSNRGSSYLIRLAQTARRLGDTPPGVDPADLPDLANVPARYYPGEKHTAGDHPPFDYSSNSAFQRAGQRLLPSAADVEVDGGGEEGGAVQQQEEEGPPAATAGGGSKKKRAGSFLLLCPDLDARAFLPPSGWAPVSLSEARRAGWADLVFTSSGYNADRRLWELRCGVRGRLAAQDVGAGFYATLLRSAPGALPETVLVAAPGACASPAPPSVPGPGVWVWRPELGYSAAAATHAAVFADQATLESIWRRHLRESPQERAIITRYLDGPALLAGRKFLIRFFIIVAAVPPGLHRHLLGGRSAYLLTRGVICSAAAPYSAGAYDDVTVHSALSGGLLRFPDDYPGGLAASDKVFKRAAAMLAAVAKILLSSAEPLPEAGAGFEVFTADTELDAGGRLWLLGVRDWAGFTAVSSLRPWLSAALFRGISLCLFGPPPSDSGGEEGPPAAVRLV
jgi:hypothetical protein